MQDLGRITKALPNLFTMLFSNWANVFLPDFMQGLQFPKGFA